MIPYPDNWDWMAENLAEFIEDGGCDCEACDLVNDALKEFVANEAEYPLEQYVLLVWADSVAFVVDADNKTKRCDLIDFAGPVWVPTSAPMIFDEASA